MTSRLIGNRVLRLAEVESTNSVASTLAVGPTEEGLVILADAQSAGRGRMGRTWRAPAKSSVLLSVILYPPKHLCQPVVLTAFGAVAVCEAIEQCTGLPATIKWPNDVLIHGKKVCGILVEQGRATVIGIGLNVNTPINWFNGVGLENAGSLFTMAGTDFDRDLVADILIGWLDRLYRAMLNGQVEEISTRWGARTELVGSEVFLDCHDGSFQGRLVAMDFSQVAIETSDGQVRGFVPEKIARLTGKMATESGTC